MHRLFPIALIFMLALAACSTDTEKRLSTLEDQAQGMAVRDEEIDDRLQALEAEVQEHMASAAGVAVAQFIMDTSGFHGMEESLTESGEIDPAFLATVTRARKVVANTTWPEELDADADSFADILVVFSESLEADDVDAATRLAIEVHEIQHDFSHAIDNWLGDGDHHD